MSVPGKIYVNVSYDHHFNGNVSLYASHRREEGHHVYIHEDLVTKREELVTKLKGYAVHDDGCRKLFNPADDCTCGLSETLRKLEE